MTVPWWRGLAPAAARVDCGGAAHVVRWEDGRLHLDGHDDLEAEDALVALGGAPTECQALAARWRRATANPALVTLGRRPGEGPVGLPAAAPAGAAPPPPPAAAPGFGALAPALRLAVEERVRSRGDLVALLALPGPMVDRLVLSAMAACAARWEDEAFRREHGLRLGAALSARAAPALRRFVERLGHGAPDVVVIPARAGGGPFFSARLEPDGPPALTAELPVGWLVDVWGRGVSEPEGRLVLSVRDADPSGRELVVDLAEWEQAGPILWEVAGVPARLVLDGDGRWTVAEVLGERSPGR